MNSHISNCMRLCAAALLSAGAGAAVAQTAPGGTIGEILNVDQITTVVSNALPPILGGDNSGIAGVLLQPRLGPPLSQTFSVPTAVEAAFGSIQPAFDPSCSRTGTTVGEPDQGNCNAIAGTASGKGAFIQLSFSKNIAVGNIRFLRRAPDAGKLNLVPVAIDDATALATATNFLSKNFGLPTAEFPLPPSIAGAPPNLSGFVSSLTVQGNGAAGDVTAPTVIGKLVHIRRGLFVKLPTDANGNTQMFVPAPGVAKVLIGANGVVAGAMVEDWRELRPNPTANASFAKSKDALTNEIVTDLLQNGGARIAHMSAHLVYGADCRSAGFCYLVPAVEVLVAPATGNLNADDMAKIVSGNIGTTAFVREYALISPDSALLPAR